jgi:hypothetical protein
MTIHAFDAEPHTLLLGIASRSQANMLLLYLRAGKSLC